MSRQTFLVIKKKFTLAYPKQYLKFPMVTTKSRLLNNIIKTIRSYLRSIGRLNNKTEYPEKSGKYSGTFLEWTPSKADTSLRGTKVLVPDEFLRNPYSKTSAKRTPP